MSAVEGDRFAEHAVGVASARERGLEERRRSVVDLKGAHRVPSVAHGPGVERRLPEGYGREESGGTNAIVLEERFLIGGDDGDGFGELGGGVARGEAIHPREGHEVERDDDPGGHGDHRTRSLGSVTRKRSARWASPRRMMV